ncbi:MAG: transposase [bacterium]
MIRGIERRSIFRDRFDYQDFLRRFKEILNENDGKCYAFALMPNHAHLLINSGKYGISNMMRILLTGYAVSFNNKYKRAGHLFQNRYKSIICNSDTYLLQLIRYIHLNPVKAKIVKNIQALENYSWTGHAALMGRKEYSWYDSDSVLVSFDDNVNKARIKYIEYLNDGLNRKTDYEGGGLARSLSQGKGMLITKDMSKGQLFDERILGDNDFIKKIYSLNPALEEIADHNVKINISLDELIKKVAEKYNIDKIVLSHKTKRKSVMRAKLLVTFIGVYKLGITNTQISKILNVSNSSISRLLSRNKELCDKYQNNTIEQILTSH